MPNAKESDMPGFGLLYSLLGYRHAATVGTIIGYCFFWVFLCSGLVILKKRQRKTGNSLALKNERTILVL